MKKKLSSKKCIALILAVVMVVTSVPLMMVGALTTGAYDPAPYWGDDATDEYGAVNTNFVATLGTDGSVSISFPNANAQKTYDGSRTKTIVKYIFTLTKLSEDGNKDELWSEEFDATKGYTTSTGAVFTITAGAEYPNNIYYGPGALETLEGYDIAATYDVAIMAIDSDGWFSDKIHTLLSDTPHYNITTDFSPEELWISRTLLDFEQAGSAGFYNGSQSTSGSGSNGPGYKGSMYSEVNSDQDQIDYLYNVNGIVDANGQMAGMGYKSSNAYRFWIKAAYTDTSFMFDSTWSRQHYNFTLDGVDNYEDAEVWFYVDFSDVEIGKMAFHLRANEKEATTWRTGKIEKAMSQYGTLFSTKAVKDINDIDKDGSTEDYINGGVQDGIYIQNADGLWEEITMTDGYVTNINGYKGYIRVPLNYFLLQENQYITSDNIREKEWTQTGSYLLGSFTTPSDFTNYKNAHMFLTSAGDWSVSVDGVACPSETVSMTFVNNKATDEKETLSVERFLVNPAGSSVTESFIIYNRFERVNARDSGWSTNSMYNWQFGNTLAFDANTTDDTDASVFSTTAMTKNGTSYNIDSSVAAKAISDIASAGFEIADWSQNSIYKSFYIDQVLICQKVEESAQSGIKYDTDTSSATYGRVSNDSVVKFGVESNFADDYGYVIKSYYDRTVEVPKAIANFITEYVGETPSLNDVNALEQINGIILTYRNSFPTVADDDSDTETLEKAVNYLNTLGYTDAYNKYVAAKTFIETYINLGDSTRNYNAVVAFESGVELLPDPDFADYSDESLKRQLEQLMALYKSFNLSHFEILGASAEEKFITLYNVIMGEEVKTGYSIGGYPFIPFNDFEKNISGYSAGYSLGQRGLQYYDDAKRTDKDQRATDLNNTKNFVTYVTPDYIPQSGQNWVGNASAIGWSVSDYRASADNFLSDSNEIFDTSAYFGRMDAEISNDGFADSQGVKMNLKGDLTVTDADTDPKFATLSTTYKGQNVNNWSELQGLNLAALQLKDTYADGTTATDKNRYGTTVTGEQVRPNSFVMYVDFTDVTNIAMNIKFILKDSSGTDINCYFCGGGETDTPTIYVLDENGEWTDVQISVSAIDTSSTDFAVGLCSIASAGTSLEGYKGFIRIPLSMFRIPKRDGLEENYLILENNLNNYTVTQAKISFWDYDAEDKNIGKSINIDAMGFTYDPGCQTRIISDPSTIVNTLNENNGLNSDVEKYGIRNMDEYFGVKTNDSVNFEKMVAELDPYEGKDAFVTAYNNAIKAHDKLSLYQQNLDEIKHCYNDLLLGKYLALGENDGANYDTVIAQEPWIAKYATADDLVADLGSLDSKITGFDISASDNAITEFYNHDNGEITYEKLGVASADEALTIASTIKEIYEKGYCRLSGTEKEKISADDLAKLENAYDAANRILLLEEYQSSINNFSGEITKIYKTEAMTEAETGVDVTYAEPDERMVEYNQEEALANALTLYEDMSVFAKEILEVTAGGAYNNMHAAAEAIYDNSAPINIMNTNSQITGGVVAFETRMKDCATDVSAKISVRTVLDTATLNEIEYCLGQTESFLPRYAQVREINQAYHELADLLPVADVETTTTQALLTNADGGASYTTDVDLTYVAARLNRTISVYVVTDYKWTQTTGTTYDFGYFTVNGTTGTDGTTLYTKIGDYANGATAEINPVVSVDETASKNVPNGAQYSGTIKVVAFDSSLITDGVDFTTLTPLATVEVPVVFQSTNGTDPLVYEVTIPAKVQVDWETTNAVDVSYSVEATLGSNELSVSVSNDGTDKLINDDTGTTYELAYSKANFGTETFTGDVAEGTKPANAPTITVTGWDTVPVGTYSTQLTYTVDVTS